MPLVNLTVLSSTRSHISWTVIQVEDGLTFVTLFRSIIAGSHPRLHVDELLSRSTLEKVFVGHSKEAMSIVDELLGVNDVCSLFGSHIKYLVRLQSLGLDDPNSSQAVPLRNAFTVLMSSSRAMKDCAKLPSTIVVRTKKDQLYNDVIAFLEKNRWEWTTGGESYGKEFVQGLHETLWYLDGHHQIFADRSHPIPSLFKGFIGYNTPELSKHRKRSHTNMSSDALKSHACCLKAFLLSPWIKKPVWDTLRKGIEELTEAIESYCFELDEKRKAMKVHHNTPIVADDDLAFSVLKVTKDFPIILNPICEAVKEKGCYEPIAVRDFAPIDRRKRYAYVMQLERGLSVRCVMITRSYGSNIGNYRFLWRIPEHVTMENTLAENQRVVTKILQDLPTYHTRCMRQEFISKFGRISPTTKPVVLREIYRELTGDSGASLNTHEGEMDERLREAILMEDSDLLVDLRELNSNQSDKYKVFWEQCHSYLQECTAVHERRHDSATYLAKALSVRDLVEQVSKKCPQGTPIPSQQWVRLQFCPRNPRTKTAALYRKRLPVKMMVQKRQFRKGHVDEHYCAAIFRYLREYALQFRNESLLICLDDKHRIKCGEPGFPVAAAERGRRVIVSLNEEFQVGDHDFTRFSIIPSVMFHVDIPEAIEGSWYSGQVCITFKEGVFQPSSPMRHGAELSSWLTTQLGSKSILFLYTDGGPDHRLTYVSTQLSLISLFLNLNLDLLCAARTAPNQSWRNPVERIMSIVNLGLQSVGVMRKEMSAEAEKALKNCNTLKSIRSTGDRYRKEIAESVQVPIDLLSDIMRRLELNGKKFEVETACSDDEVECFWEILQQIEASLSPDDTTRDKIRDKTSLQQFFSHCCQLRHYTFCIKKCGKIGCKMCKPVRMEKETFEKLKFLPDPQMQDDGHYLPFQEAFALNTTTEQDRPSQKGKRKASPLSFSPSVQHARNTDTMVQCDECSMWRLLFSKRKLSVAERANLQVVLEDISYTCGASLDELDLPDRLSTVVIRNHQCGDAIERLYYSAGYEDICIYCATTSNLVQSLQDSYPICSSCHDTHQPVKKRQR